MQCPNCGAELRPTARFCNVCGAAAAEAANARTNGKHHDGAAGARRGTVAEPAPAQSAGTGRGQPSRGGSMPPLTALAAAHRPTITAKLDDRDMNLADAVTDEHTMIGPHGTAALGSAANSASGQPGGGNRPDDQLPWPLPNGIIMDGRYRVEMLLSGSDEECVYRVTDLRGYERCWACGKVYGASGASDRFCQECGADMLAREYVLFERRLGEHEAPPAEGAASARQSAAATPDGEAARTFNQGGRAYRVEPRLAHHAAFPRGARLIAGAATDLGRTRSGEQNEDSALVLVLDRLHENQTVPFGVFVVADGLGGHANGHRASRLAVNVLVHTILRQVALPVVGSPTDTPVDETILANLLADAVRTANGSLCAANREADLDAGSTVVAVLIYGETAHIANVGDSRGYVCDDDGLRRITVDHSLVQQLVAGGLIAPDDVYTHPQRNQIFRSLGDDPDLAVDLFAQQLRPGMRLLLCSDGLWEMVRDPQIEQILRAAPDPQAACDALVAAANEGGGEDNITVVVVEAR
jgi:serine/threonine protein phosphatase PrpC